MLNPLNDTMSKRSLGDLTVDIAPPAKKMRVTTMPVSDNKIGTFDEKAVPYFLPLISVYISFQRKDSMIPIHPHYL